MGRPNGINQQTTWERQAGMCRERRTAPATSGKKPARHLKQERPIQEKGGADHGNEQSTFCFLVVSVLAHRLLLPVPARECSSLDFAVTDASAAGHALIFQISRALGATSSARLVGRDEPRH